MKNFDRLLRIYIASPYTYKTRIPFLRRIMEWYRWYKVTKVTARLEQRFRASYIMPITMSHLTQVLVPTLGGEFSSWADVDYTYIDACDIVAVIMIPGWKKSIGVKKEIKFAAQRSIPVVFIDPNTLNTYMDGVRLC